MRHDRGMHEEPVNDPVVTARFRDVAGRVLDAMLAARPERATDLGDHRFDDRLTDYSPEAVSDQAVMLAEALAALDDVDDSSLVTDDRVDLEILRTQITGTLWELTELRRYEHDPLAHLPGDALYPLIARSTGEPGMRLKSLAARLALVPGRLETAQDVLHDMPRVHVETAIGQARGTVAMLTSELGPLLAQEPRMAGRVEPVRDAALGALAGHVRWGTGFRRPTLVHARHRDQSGGVADPGRERLAGHRGGDRRTGLRSGRGPAGARAGASHAGSRRRWSARE